MIAHRFMGGMGHPPCVILHGLLGSSRNWLTVGRRLSDHFEVYGLDARNHGQSPHAEPVDYPSMAQDLFLWCEHHLRQPFVLIGHSMGGKTAMTFAIRHPRWLQRLVVVDIAVKAYPARWEREFALMKQLPLQDLQSRAEAEQWLEPEISDWAFRKFLTTNLQVGEDGRLRWAINLPLLEDNLPNLFGSPLTGEDRFDGDVLWIRGENSRFVQDGDWPGIQRHFPKARLVTVPDAGHNVHFANPQGFLQAVMES